MAHDIHLASPLIVPRPLTPEGFAPFGEVVAHQGSERRHYLTEPTRHGPQARHPTCWVSRVDTVPHEAVAIRLMERHRHAAQTFVPLRPVPYLVVVAPTAASGLPDMTRLQAFRAEPGQGICYRIDTWHHGLTVLESPAEFLVMMALTGQGNDDEFWQVPAPHRLVSLSL